MFGWTEQSFDRRAATAITPVMDSTLAGVPFGIVAGTKVASRMGWRPVEAIAAGDEVLTFDGGLQAVVAVERRTVVSDACNTPEEDWPLFVPAGALGNREEMLMLPGQTVLIESDAAEEAFGDPFALIPAVALDGFRGITRIVPEARLEIVTLHFAQDEIVFANVGALFHCPRTTDLVAEVMAQNAPVYDVLPMEDAETLVLLLEIEDGAAHPVRSEMPTGDTVVPLYAAA